MICKFAVYYTCSSGYCLGESLVRHFSVNFCCFVKIKPISNQFKSLVNPCRESKGPFYLVKCILLEREESSMCNTSCPRAASMTSPFRGLLTFQSFIFTHPEPTPLTDFPAHFGKSAASGREWPNYWQFLYLSVISFTVLVNL